MSEVQQMKSILKQGITRHINILLDCEFQEKLLKVINDYENTKHQLQLKEVELEERKKEIIGQDKYIDKLKKEYDNQLQQKDNIIKEVREILNQDKASASFNTAERIALEILDKENKDV